MLVSLIKSPIFEVDLSMYCTVVAVSRMTGNGGSQSFKRRASGVAAEIEAKYSSLISSCILHHHLFEVVRLSCGLTQIFDIVFN